MSDTILQTQVHKVACKITKNSLKRFGPSVCVGASCVFWARVLHMSQANTGGRVMDGVFVKMPSFAEVVHGVPNGSNIKRTRSGSKSRCGHAWKSDARGRNPPVLFLRTCHLPHFVRHVHENVAGGSWRCAPAVSEHIEHGLRL